MLIKKIILLVVFVLSAVCAAQAQRAEWPTIVSDEFYFIAFFPDRPTLTEGDINTRFGKGYSRRWTLESPDISYEVSVDNYPDLSVKMDYKSLNSFHDAVCSDFASQFGAKFGYHGEECFGEYGRNAGRIIYGKSEERIIKEVSVMVRMYLIRQRLYQVKVVMRNSRADDKQAVLDAIKFLDDFVFVYRKEDEKKYSYGLPESVSQNLERRKN